MKEEKSIGKGLMEQIADRQHQLEYQHMSIQETLEIITKFGNVPIQSKFDPHASYRFDVIDIGGTIDIKKYPKRQLKWKGQ